MSKHLQRDMETLEQQLLAQSSLVEEMICEASRAMSELRPEVLEQLAAKEQRVDQQEVQIEEGCLKILALHQPVAVDLRRTATILKINSDLERMADLAVNVAQRARSLSRFPEFIVPEPFARMTKLAISMLRESMDALVNLNLSIARDVCTRDDEVDDLCRELIKHTQDLMRSDPAKVESALFLFSASRHVERIADHATNIAEDVIYLIDGEIARHKHGQNSNP